MIRACVVMLLLGVVIACTNSNDGEGDSAGFGMFGIGRVSSTWEWNWTIESDDCIGTSPGAPDSYCGGVERCPADQVVCQTVAGNDIAIKLSASELWRGSYGNDQAAFLWVGRTLPQGPDPCTDVQVTMTRTVLLEYGQAGDSLSGTDSLTFTRSCASNPGQSWKCTLERTLRGARIGDGC